MDQPKWILPVIVITQFGCISLWFAGNGVMANLISDFKLDNSALGHLTSAVQFGFITGTLIFAIYSIADRYSPSKVFFISALLGAIFNFLVIFKWNSFYSLLFLRFLTGFFLAGIYPVGMKIAADYFQEKLSKSLGYLVGALVIGTAFPHLLKGLTSDLPWKSVLMITSALAIFGGFIMFLLIPNGPYRKPGHKPDFSTTIKVFKDSNFRSAAFGYFGHMWELYAYWAFVPVILITYSKFHSTWITNVPVLSFFIIGIGGLACMLGGYISLKIGTKRTAFMALLFSCLCCLLSPIVFKIDSAIVLLIFLLFWGMVVVADSPLFSTLVAQNVVAESKGTALTIVNCIGFSITILSIQIINILIERLNPEYVFLILALGPIIGLYALYSEGESVLLTKEAKG
jgi:predicted MFS family arabinose efflux permease